MNISTYGLQNDDKFIFIAMLTIAASDLELSWNFNDQNADVILVDIEQTEGKNFWLKHHTNKQLIAFAHENHVDAPWFLEKPIELEKLKSLLKLVSQNNSSNDEIEIEEQKQPIVESAAPIVTSDVFEPSLFLIGVLLKPEALCIRVANFAPLYIFPEQKNCFTTENINFLNLNSEQINFFEAEVSQIETEVLTADEIQSIPARSDLYKYSIDSFLWAATLYASKGRLLAGFSTEETGIQLKQWPDFSIFSYEATHIRLAAIMIKQIVTFQDLAKKAGISINIVFNFFNACYMTQIVDISKSNNEIKEMERIHSAEQHVVFQRILNRLLR